MLDPKNINYRVSRSQLSNVKYSGIGRVEEGDWDKSENTITIESRLMEAIRKRFIEGIEWEDTKYDNKLKYKFKNSEEKYRYLG